MMTDPADKKVIKEGTDAIKTHVITYHVGKKVIRVEMWDIYRHIITVTDEVDKEMTRVG